MLRVNVGLSRKLSKDYNSTGYSINLDGEITAPISDDQGVVEQVKELFDLAEEALNQQIERERSLDAVAQRDGNGHSATPPSRQSNGHGARRPAISNGHDSKEAEATNKQIQYLLTLAKRQRLSTLELEQKIADVLGYNVNLYDLTKKAAGTVIDALNGRSLTATGADRN